MFVLSAFFSAVELASSRRALLREIWVRRRDDDRDEIGLDLGVFFVAVFLTGGAFLAAAGAFFAVGFFLG